MKIIIITLSIYTEKCRKSFAICRLSGGTLKQMKFNTSMKLTTPEFFSSMKAAYGPKPCITPLLSSDGSTRL